MGQASEQDELGALRALVNGVAASEEGVRPAERGLASGWPSLDAWLGQAGGVGLARGVLHEWLGLDETTHARPVAWRPPLFVLTELAARAFEDVRARGRSLLVLWIGRRVWPYAPTLVHRHVAREVSPPWGAAQPGSKQLEVEFRAGGWAPRVTAADQELLAHSLFLDPPNEEVRLWALDVALRSDAVCAVVADGSRLAMAATRRLQLAARAGDALALFARPAHEVRELSCASTRCLVRRVPFAGRAGGHALRFELELLRAKSSGFASERVS